MYVPALFTTAAAIVILNTNAIEFITATAASRKRSRDSNSTLQREHHSALTLLALNLITLTALRPPYVRTSAESRLYLGHICAVGARLRPPLARRPLPRAALRPDGRPVKIHGKVLEPSVRRHLRPVLPRPPRNPRRAFEVRGGPLRPPERFRSPRRDYRLRAEAERSRRRNPEPRCRAHSLASSQQAAASGQARCHIATSSAQSRCHIATARDRFAHCVLLQASKPWR